MGEFSAKEIIKRLARSGDRLHSIKGSHHVFKNALGNRIVVSHPKKDLPKGTFYAVLKQAGPD